jgi:hypothetical protein
MWDLRRVFSEDGLISRKYIRVLSQSSICETTRISCVLHFLSSVWNKKNNYYNITKNYNSYFRFKIATLNITNSLTHNNFFYSWSILVKFPGKKNVTLVPKTWRSLPIKFNLVAQLYTKCNKVKRTDQRIYSFKSRLLAVKTTLVITTWYIFTNSLLINIIF